MPIVHTLASPIKREQGMFDIPNRQTRRGQTETDHAGRPDFSPYLAVFGGAALVVCLSYNVDHSPSLVNK